MEVIEFENGERLEVERIDSKRRYQGAAVYYWESGEWEEFEYVDGIKEGEAICHDQMEVERNIHM